MEAKKAHNGANFFLVTFDFFALVSFLTSPSGYGASRATLYEMDIFNPM